MAIGYMGPFSKWVIAAFRTGHGELQQQHNQLEAVQRVSQALFRTIDLDQLVETTLRTALDEVSAKAGSILLADVHTKQLVFQYSLGEKPVPRGTTIPWDKGISGAVFQSGEPRITSNVQHNTGHYGRIDQDTGFVTRDMITLPLRRWKGEPIGVLNVLNKRGGMLGPKDLTLLTIISAFAALAIQQAHMFEDAKKAEVVTLLGDIGHDMKNMLQPVVSGLELLKDEVDELFADMPEAERNKKKASQKLCNEAADMMKSGIRRVHSQVRDMADCVKGLSSLPNFAPCKVAVIVGEAIKTLEILAKEKAIVLKTEGLDALPEFLADERRLYNAFYNLINNAIPETPAGGSITVGGSLEPSEKSIAFWVADTGRGMPPEIRERLFSARAVSTKKGGTGLGTKIVKDVIDAHQGKIWVESEIGVGTTFHFRLPVNAEEAVIS
jgi:signal transduction histidine kinase